MIRGGFRGLVSLFLAVGCGSVTGTPMDAVGGDSAPGADASDLDGAVQVDAPAGPHLVIAQPSHDFGSLARGSTSAAFTFMVTNDGDADTSTLAATLSGAGAADFRIASDGCGGTTLAASGTCEVDVVYVPIVEGGVTATLQVSAGPASASASVSGTGLNPDGLFITPGSWDFGSAPLGGMPSRVFVLENGASVTSGTISIGLSGASASQFTISHACPTTLAPNGTCNITVDFAPTATGAKTASLDASASPGGLAAASLSGSAITPASITLAPASGSATDFGNVLVGGTATMTYVVTNTGQETSGNLGTSITSGDFAILTGGASDCVAGSPLPGLATCELRVQFTPTSNGTKLATLGATASPGGTPALSLRGVGQNPAQLTADATFSFGNLAVGSASAAQVWTISNAGDVATGTLSFANGNPGELGYTSTCPSGGLGGGASCTVNVTLTPSTYGARSGSLTLSATPGGAIVGNATATGMWRLTTAVLGGGGNISATGINCGSDCSELYANNTVVGLQARTTNGSGFHFVGWDRDCLPAGSVRDCTLTMNGHKDTRGTFSANTYNLAFVSSIVEPANLGSAAAYDTECNRLATAAGINNAPGTAFTAWISTAASTAASRINPSVGGFVRMDDRPFALSYTDLTAGRIRYPLRVTELGEVITSWEVVWSGTTELGGATGVDCSGWMTNLSGTSGSTAEAQGGPGFWSQYTSSTCNIPRRIFCFMDSSTAAVPAPGAPPAGSKLAYYTTTGIASGGGIAALNAHCNANKPAGAGTTRAFVATTTASAGSILGPATTYYRPDGTIIGTGGQIAANQMLSNMWQRNDGTYVNGPTTTAQPWGGAGNPSLVGTATSTCSDYVSTASTLGMFADVNWMAPAWMGWEGAGCNSTRPVMCVEQ